MNRLSCSIILVMLSIVLNSCSFTQFISQFSGKSKRFGDTVFVYNDQIQQQPKISLPEPENISTIAQVKQNPAIDSSALIQQRIGEVTPIWKKRVNYKTFSAKAKISFSGPDDSKDFTANFRIRKDSLIWIQITALGGLVQAARVCITPDSFYMVNYIDKEFIRISLAKIASVLPVQVEFAALENMITGDPLRDGDIKKVCDTGKQCTIYAEDNGYVQNVCYNMADSTMESGMICTHDTRGPNALIRYINYELAGGRKFAKNRILTIRNGQSEYSAEINFVNMDFDIQLEFPFSIPQSYTKNSKE